MSNVLFHAHQPSEYKSGEHTLFC